MQPCHCIFHTLMWLRVCVGSRYAYMTADMAPGVVKELSSRLRNDSNVRFTPVSVRALLFECSTSRAIVTIF